MRNSVKRGNYYKNKTRDWLIDQGYKVEFTEFMAAQFIGPGQVIYRKRDVLASDGIAYTDKEFILWNSKHTTTGDISKEKSKGKKEYEAINTPPFIKKWLIIWQPRKKPEVVEIKNPQ